MTKPFPFTRLTPEQAKQDYPALFATFKAEFSWSDMALSSNYDKMIAAMVSIAVEATSYLSDIKKLREFSTKKNYAALIDAMMILPENESELNKPCYTEWYTYEEKPNER